MRGLKRIFFFCITILLMTAAQARIKDIGIPSIVNYSRNTYNASTQNWSIAQSSRGYMYFGNNDGILEYNGTSWKLYELPNSSVVRSVMARGDTIYAGGFEEIGYLAPDFNGKLVWHSLNHLIPEKYASYDEVWNIFAYREMLVFQTFKYVFVFQNQSLRVIEPIHSFSFMHQVHDAFYIVDQERGLMMFQNDSLKHLSGHPVFFRNEIRCVLPYAQNKLLIGTSNEGVFIWDGQQLNPWDTPVNIYLKKDNLFSGTKVSNGYYAFGSVSNGLFVTNPQGNILQHLNRFKGLQNNTILSLYEDRNRNLWIGLDNGIDFLELSSPLSAINYNYNIESAYSSLIHNNYMYIGTNQGLFAAPVSRQEQTLSFEGTFQLIPGTEGQVWDLQVKGNTLLCGHNFGSFQIKGIQARQISDMRGFWSFLPVNANTLLAGTYSGLVHMEKIAGQWQVTGRIEGFEESSRNIFLDQNHVIWVSHGYRGLYRLKLTPDLERVKEVRLFGEHDGLPPQLPYNIQTFNNNMYITAGDGIYSYDPAKEAFSDANDLHDLFISKGFVDKLHQDQRGNIWYFTDPYMGVFRLLEDGTYRDITTPFSRINDFLLPAFQNIFVMDVNNVFIGSQIGLIHYDPSIILDYKQWERVWFDQITFYGKKDESLSRYNFNTELQGQKKIQLPYAQNSVQFHFTLPVYEDPEKITFLYMLEGFDTQWTEGMNIKEYTNLREGDYLFKVKARNVFGVESEISTFAFSISPPFIRSRPAYAIYAFLFFIIVSGNAYYVRKRILKIRQREKIRHEKRLARREQIFAQQSALSEKEIMDLRNQSLQNEMQHKNKELANATLHLIQKNKTLTALKNELNKLSRHEKTDSAQTYLINGLIKKINKDLRNEQNWELFNSYFDEVHQDFISQLKEKYSDLSPKELRLCAYLRMNISTKEIAPLMNISVRGVEISRYRLRKKLNLEHDTNLTEFIMSF